MNCRGKASTYGNNTLLTGHELVPRQRSEKAATPFELHGAHTTQIARGLLHGSSVSTANSEYTPGCAVNDDGEPYPPGLEPGTLYSY